MTGPGLQVLDLRDVVDPAVHHPGHCRSGADHPHPGASGGEHQPGKEDGRGAVAQKRAGPTAEEIAAALDMEPDQVRELLQLAQEPISLETPVGEEEDAIWRILFRTRMPASRWTRPGVSCCGGSCCKRPQKSDTPGGAGHHSALRSGGWPCPHAGRAGKGVQRDPGTGAPDRGQRRCASCAIPAAQSCCGIIWTNEHSI